MSDRKIDIEPWYGGYALLGAVAAGLVPILLPLLATRAGSDAITGVVMAAFNLGMLASPLWGALAEGRRLHAPLFAAALIALAAALAAFAVTKLTFLWIGLALLQGVAVAAATTVANLAIVGFHPKKEWGRRLGWLQTFYGGGQVAGLVLAGALGGGRPDAGLWLAAALAVAGVPFARWLPGAGTRLHLPGIGHAPAPGHGPRHAGLLLGAGLARVSPAHLRAGLARLPQLLRRAEDGVHGPFGRFLLAWFVANLGTSSVFAFYPLLMKGLFGLGPAVSSWGFAGSAALGLLLYAPAGAGVERRGSGWVFRFGLALRLLALLALLLLALPGMFPSGSVLSGILAVAFFAVVVLSWSILVVSSTERAAELTKLPEGEALGLYGGVGAVAAVIGSLVGGILAATLGYGSLLAFGAAGVALAIVLDRERS